MPSDPIFQKYFSLETPVHYISSLTIDEKSRSLFEPLWQNWRAEHHPAPPDPQIQDFLHKAATLGVDNKPWVNIQFVNPLKGYGVFAVHPLPKNILLTLYAGILTHNSFISLGNRYLFCFQDFPYFMINAQKASNWARFINHGEKNASNLVAAAHHLPTGPHIILYTQRAIQAGEELLLDYGSDYWAHHPKIPLPILQTPTQRFNVHKDQFKALAKLTQRK